jgi:hypothetical protein
MSVEDVEVVESRVEISGCGRGPWREVGGAWERVGEGEARAEGVDNVWDVVAAEDAREDVFGCADGHGGLDEAVVAFEGVIDGDVLEAGIEDGGVEEDEAEVSGGDGHDVIGICTGLGSEEIDCLNHIINTQT